MRWHSVILLLLLSVPGCDIDDYHYIGLFTNRLAAEQKALEELLDEYDDLDKGYYKILYQFPENNADLKYAVWYDKNLQQLGIENDIYSGMCCAWKGVDQSLLKALVAEKKGIQKARLSKLQIHPDWSICPY